MQDSLQRLRQWLSGDPARSSERAAEPAAHRATTMLLVEAARLDGVYGEAERARISSLLADRFGLSADATEALVQAGEKAQEDAVDMFGSIRTLKTVMSEQEREALIEMLWEVVYADGQLHDFEANLMRRIASLLSVEDRASALAHQRVRRRLEDRGTEKEGR